MVIEVFVTEVPHPPRSPTRGHHAVRGSAQPTDIGATSVRYSDPSIQRDEVASNPIDLVSSGLGINDEMWRNNDRKIDKGMTRIVTEER